MCLPYTALANSASSNYPVLVLHCKVPANNERFAGGSYKALLLSLLFAGTLWWQLKRDGPGVAQREGGDTGQSDKTLPLFNLIQVTVVLSLAHYFQVKVGAVFNKFNSSFNVD